MIDTNTLASGALARTGPVAALVDAWRSRRVEWVISDHILRELDRTLRKPYFAVRLSELDRRAFISLVREFASVVEIVEPIPTVLGDDADNLVLATALSAKVPYIVSGDRELQQLGEFQGVRIVSARVFLDLAMPG